MISKFTSSEKRSIFGMSLVLSSRILGLSLLLPVFSIYVHGLQGATPFLVGITMGAYGLTQTLFQVPFGLLSDKYGRKSIIILGLALFAGGSIIAGLTSDIYWLMCARLLQGSGAIASSCLAWISDATDESRRNTSMAFMGMAIGASITIGMIVGPLVGGAWHVQYLFWICLFLALASMTVLTFFLKEPIKHKLPTNNDGESAFTHWGQVLKGKELWKLDLSGFIKNLCMTAVFFAVPLVLKQHYHMLHMWKIYVPMTFLGITVMMGCSRLADRGYAKHFLLFGFGLIAVSIAVIACSENHLFRLLCGFFAYYTGHAVLEPLMPSAVSKLAPKKYTGTTLGVFNMCQYFGTFCGAMLAGSIISSGHANLFFIISGIAAIGLAISGFTRIKTSAA